MTSQHDNKSNDTLTDRPAVTEQDAERQYEKSGLYPENGKPFRMWALFGWLTLLIAALAGIAAILNIYLLELPS